MKKFQLFPVLIIVFGFLFTSNLWALKNVCRECRTMAALTDLICKKCRKPLNRCLACGTMNPVSADYCLQCGEMLAEMRVLETIDPELREELRLGQSDRAQAERELAKINNQMEKEPEKLEIYLYRQAKIFRKMKFYSREAQAWKEYLEKFPKSPRKNRINAFYSEALRLWGYLFYEQGDFKTALEKFEAAVTANPMNAEAWMWVGRLKNEAKDIEGSAKAYLSALEARPGDKTAIHFLKKMKKTVPAGLLKPTAPRIPPGMEMALEATSTAILPSRDGGVPGAPKPANRPDGDVLAGLASAPQTAVPMSASDAISVPAGAPPTEAKKGQEEAKIIDVNNPVSSGTPVDTASSALPAPDALKNE